jgi:hypothetical protein
MNALGWTLILALVSALALAPLVLFTAWTGSAGAGPDGHNNGEAP